MQINWIAIALAVLSNFALGFIWYNPKVFGSMWLRSIGKDPATFKPNMKKMPYIMLASLVGAFFMAFVMYMIITVGHAAEGPQGTGHEPWFGHGMLHGFMIALGTAIPILIMNGLYEEKKTANILIHLGYWIVSMMLMGGIIDVLRIPLQG